MGADSRKQHETYGQSTLTSVIKERKTKAGMHYLCGFSRRLIVVVPLAFFDDDDDGRDEVSSSSVTYLLVLIVEQNRFSLHRVSSSVFVDSFMIHESSIVPHFSSLEIIIIIIIIITTLYLF